MRLKLHCIAFEMIWKNEHILQCESIFNEVERKLFLFVYEFDIETETNLKRFEWNVSYALNLYAILLYKPSQSAWWMTVCIVRFYTALLTNVFKTKFDTLRSCFSMCCMCVCCIRNSMSRYSNVSSSVDIGLAQC